MTPPEAPQTGSATGDRPPAISVCLTTLVKRSEFLAAARARRASGQAMMMQARKRRDGEADGMRVGFTCSKKVGNAVARNRAKRRLREVARLVLPELGRDGWDYVLIGRKDVTASLPFETLLDDLRKALPKLHSASSQHRRAK